MFLSRISPLRASRVGFSCILIVTICNRFDASIAHSNETQGKTEWIQNQIDKLGNDSYVVRQSARRSLVEIRNDVSLRPLLVAGLRHESLEVQHQTLSILRLFDMQAFDEQLVRLKDTRWPASEISLPTWKRFSQAVGNDRASRRVFEQMVRRFGDTLRSLDRDQRIERFDSEFDPYRIEGGDALRWCVLLMCDQPDVDHEVKDMSHRILNALCNQGLGPKTKTADERKVTQRLICHWIDSHPNVGTQREHMLVAMRFECFEHAERLCDRVLSNANASPSVIVTALLVASVSQRDDLISQLEQRLEDDRTAHVWQLIASQRAKIRTQVRDVALALMLHHHDIDPRRAGFNELQADPKLVFRDHSLGFPSEDARREAIARAHELLANELLPHELLPHELQATRSHLKANE